MESYQRDFIELCIKAGVLQFGEFTLKSGRVSPYFFNAGRFNTGAQLAEIGVCYAHALQNSRMDFDVLFGPAYKGIPLVSTAVMALFNKFNLDIPYCFNRKEVKDRGEGGNLVGASLTGRVCIIDDVITAGTAIRESVDLIQKAGAKLAGVLVLLDREERGQGELSAIGEIERDLQVSVFPVITLSNIIEFVENDNQFKSHVKAIKEYRARYGVN